jgi:chromate transporter
MVIAAALLLFQPIEATYLNIGIVIATFSLLLWTKIPPYVLIFTGILAGMYIH